MVVVSLVALGVFSVVFGVFMHESSEGESLGARVSPEKSEQRRLASSTAASERVFAKSRGGFAGESADGLEDGEAINAYPDLGGGEWLEDDDDYEVDECRDDTEGPYDSREFVEDRVAAITAEAEHEAVDADWAPATELGIADGVAAHAPPGTRLVSTTCKTTLCVAELELPPGSHDSASLSWLAAAGVSRGLFVQGEVGAGGSARTVAYLAREGYSLPSSVGQYE